MGVIKLPFIHRDPFDRILVATAIWENMPLLTNDSTLSPQKLSWEDTYREMTASDEDWSAWDAATNDGLGEDGFKR
jgi:hypothetical protein